MDNIRLGSMYYKITETDKDVILNYKVCRGMIDYENHEITISNKENDKQNRFLTLLHEVVHGMLYENNLHELNSEENVENISKALYQVIIDNKELFKVEEV